MVVADMHLETMALCRCLAVIGNGNGQEMELDIGLLHPRCRPHEGAGFELVGAAKPGAGRPVPLEDLDPETPHAIRGARRDGVLVLQLPYEEHEVSMVLLAPEAVALGAFEATLDGATYAGLVADLPLAEGEVGLPRFELRSKIDLIPHAQGLGVTAPFDASTADFSRLTDPDDGLVITDFLHEAFVRVDERGTEAAAATAAVVGRVSAPEPLVVDRPFVFVIQDDLTGAVLFVGRVTDPR